MTGDVLLLKEEVTKELTERILPFWRLKDKENGGFYGRVDYDFRFCLEGMNRIR